jgi:hypothetical protein
MGCEEIKGSSSSFFIEAELLEGREMDVETTRGGPWTAW